MENLSFDNLPKAISTLLEKVTKIENLLSNKSNLQESDQLLTIKEAAHFLHLSVPTLYSYVSKNEIPFSKRPNSKRLWFSKQDLLSWIKESRKKTIAEIGKEANTLLKKRGV